MRIWAYDDREREFISVFRRTAEAAGYDVRMLKPEDEPSPYSELVRRYVHLSPNTPEFELACFRRYFEVAQNVSDEDYFIIADTDLFVQTSVERLPQPLRDADSDFAGSIGISDGVREEDISPHFSFWKGRQLRRFTTFLLEIYASETAVLREIHARRLAAGNARASISDMTLLYLWVAAEKVAFQNTNNIYNGQYIDHNISMPSCCNGTFQTVFGRKKLYFDRSRVALRTDAGEVVEPAVLHLQGRYKLIAGDLEGRARASVTAKSIYIQAGRGARSAQARIRSLTSPG